MILNCYENTVPLAKSIEGELQHLLDTTMRPECYGKAVNRLRIFLHFSEESYHKIGNYTTYTQTNYVIADKVLNLKKKDLESELRKMFSRDEIKQNSYYLKNRFDMGSFMSKTGTQRMKIYFDRAFSQLSYEEQKFKIVMYLINILEQSIAKLKKKNLAYDFDMMLIDFKKILNEWQ